MGSNMVNVVLNIINIIAIVIIPIIAVLIGQFLQNRSEKRKDKMRVFTHLMSYRSFGYSDNYSVNVFNSVPIVFTTTMMLLKNIIPM